MLFDGVLELLTELRQRRHRLAVATGKSRHRAERRAVDSAAARRVRRHAHGRRTASKPDPRMLSG